MEPAIGDARRAGIWPRVKRGLAWALMLSALGYITWMLRGQYPELASATRRFTPLAVTLALVAFVPMFVLKGIYHARLLQQLGHRSAPLPKLTATYLQAQLVRYLPGKIWGLVYQHRTIRESHDAGSVVFANMWQMFVTNVLALGVIVGLLGLHHLGAWSVAVVFSAAILVEVIHRAPSLRDQPIAWLAERFQSLRIIRSGRTGVPDPWISTGILVAEWVLFLLGFVLLFGAQLSSIDAMLLGAWYGTASILALAAFVVPAGLAVREAIFVSSGSLVPDADPAFLLVAATMLRFLMILAEFLAAASISVLQKISRHEK